MADPDYKTGRLDRKYYIQKRCKNANASFYCPTTCKLCGGAGVVHIDPSADYFVLWLDEDPNARDAAVAYAVSVMGDNPLFAWDILGSVKVNGGSHRLNLNDAIRDCGQRLADEVQHYRNREIVQQLQNPTRMRANERPREMPEVRKS